MEYITSKNVQRLRALKIISKEALTCIQNLQGRDRNLEARVDGNDVIFESSGEEIARINQKGGTPIIYEDRFCKDKVKAYALGIQAAGYNVPERYLV